MYDFSCIWLDLCLNTSFNVKLAGAQLIIKVLGHQYRWLAGCYDLEIGHFWKGQVWWLLGG